MDNKQTFQVPQMQSAQPMAGGQPNQTPLQSPIQSPSHFQTRPMQQQPAPVVKKDISGLVKTIVIIALSLLAVTFIGLFIWKAVECNDAQTDLNGKIEQAVAVAKEEQATKLEAEFLEREKDPYKTFSGPVDYGQLTFKYPKTWSVYVAEAATTGGDYAAFFNPIQVDAIGKDTINALRVTIRDDSFDDVTAEYQKYVDDKKVPLTIESVSIGVGKKITANRYTGTIPDTELSGYIVTFKIRDKTAVLETDSVTFEGDFNALLDTVSFNE
ncbi:hypothetical protein IKF28_00300 [Candidatus Saccharibacteria bacterium]|nr:hypothetical protein [Candidatus Saccharibacteria bacterium]MBR3121874.1 hypothetical protein [Candidatus Saccharibacteria bacterium]